MSEPQVKEATQVTMTDGRVLSFGAKQKMLKDSFIENGQVKVRFDFINGETRLFTCPESLVLQCASFGASTKIRNETAGEQEIDDMVLAVEDIISRLERGEWGATRKSGGGDSFSGASVVIRAICEATGKSVADVKAFLDGKLETAKAKGESLTRAALYASFRNPNSKTGQIIERLEREKKSKTAVNADDLLGELA